MGVSAKPRRGRPLTPGNKPGGDGCPQMMLRLPPEEMEQVRARGGQPWVRGLIREALQAGQAAEGEEA